MKTNAAILNARTSARPASWEVCLYAKAAIFLFVNRWFGWWLHYTVPTDMTIVNTFTVTIVFLQSFWSLSSVFTVRGVSMVICNCSVHPCVPRPRLCQKHRCKQTGVLDNSIFIVFQQGKQGLPGLQGLPVSPLDFIASAAFTAFSLLPLVKEWKNSSSEEQDQPRTLTHTISNEI